MNNKHSSYESSAGSDKLNDDDVHQLFNQQTQQVPQALDDKILALAEHATHNNRASKRAAGLATAAVLLIGIGLYPILRSPPATHQEISSTDNTAATMAEPEILLLESTAQDAQGKPRALASPAAKLSADSERQKIAQERRSELSRKSSLAAADDAASLRFRKTPELWIANIKNAFEAGLENEARTELSLFKKQHVNHALLKTLPAELHQPGNDQN